MSKKKSKKSKPAATKAPKKAAPQKKFAKKAPKTKMKTKSVAASRETSQLPPPPLPTRRNKTATIMIFKTGTGTKIRTSPQRIYANRGDHVEFNIVNMIDDTEVPVTIEFPGGGPWGKEPFEIRNWERKPLGDADHGRFKYTIRALDAEEDPEIELPEGN
jgi:hypothetical protein